MLILFCQKKKIYIYDVIDTSLSIASWINQEALFCTLMVLWYQFYGVVDWGPFAFQWYWKWILIKQSFLPVVYRVVKNILWSLIRITANAVLWTIKIRHQKTVIECEKSIFLMFELFESWSITSTTLTPVSSYLIGLVSI